MIFLFGLFSFFGNSQERIPQNYQDSLALAKEKIDILDMSNLVKQQERFIYLSRTTSYNLFDEISLYINNRIKTLNDEK